MSQKNSISVKESAKVITLQVDQQQVSRQSIGILLVNLGTPDAPTPKAVRRYLKQFLSDPRVIDIPAIARWLLLHTIILPFRSRQSAKAYQSIWTSQGSPLLMHSQRFCDQIAEKLGDRFKVQLGMRYGNPSITAALEVLQAANCSKIICLPLFPQYASASSGSAIEEIFRVLSQKINIPAVEVMSDFYEYPGFIQSMVSLWQPKLTKFKPDYILWSFHGLPVRQVQASEAAGFGACDQTKPCPTVSEQNRYCYRAQCYATANALNQALNLNSENAGIGFQSRLGRTPWIKPYTDELLEQLAKQGVKRIAIGCPSFVADCLETIEEIGIRAKEQWLSLGGEALLCLPCLNDFDPWVQVVCQQILEQGNND